MAKRKPPIVILGERYDTPVAGDLVVELEGRPMMTILADHEFWTDGLKTLPLPPENALVRVFPPANATDGQLAMLSRWGAKCATVKFLPKERANATPIAERTTKHKIGARAAVLKLAVEVPTSDREALWALCEKTLLAARL